jgi:tetratricopeptide (TPR) repeat protein/class 3 adenylate cyclase
MPDLNKMDRTWLCSVLFMDIVRYSSQSVEVQMKWKKRFNGYLAEAIKDGPESERVILDTGDGAAICFLGAPEAAMFAALQLCSSFIVDEREQQPGLGVRIGINLGPVKLVKDINGALNAIGDGINDGQRIMSFAAANQILVSRSFFEVVSRLSDDYKPMFRLKGVETDKHVREHTVYHLVPPGSEKREAAGVALPSMGVVGGRAARAEPKSSRMGAWIAGGAAIVVLGAGGSWYMGRFSAAPPGAATATLEKAPDPVPVTPPSVPAAKAPAEKKTAPPLQPRHAEAASKQPSRNAQAAFEDASHLLEQDKPAEAVKKFDDAIQDNPEYLEAYVGRAEAKRKLSQYEASLDDCNKIIRIKPDDPMGYNCRGFSNQQLNRYEAAVKDLNEAIRLNPSFSQAYLNRGNAHSSLEQYKLAIQDFNEAIRLRPRNAPFYLRRATAYNSLGQYDKALQDCSDAIRLQPEDLKAYMLRATVEDGSGNKASAAADRRHVREARKNK